MTRISDLSFALIGPGKVGSSLALWLTELGARLSCVIGRSSAASAEAAERLGTAATTLDQLPSYEPDLLLVAVPDGKIAEAAQRIAALSFPENHTCVALHCSGIQPVETLAPLRRRGLSVGGLHPLLGFPEVRVAPVPEVIYGVGGDQPAVALAESLASAFGGVPVQVPDSARLVYHYCATLAAGGVVSVLATMEEIANAAELPKEIRPGFLRLADAALESATSANSSRSVITGPIARGEGDLAAEELAVGIATVPASEEFQRALQKETHRHVDGESNSRKVAKTRSNEEENG